MQGRVEGALGQVPTAARRCSEAEIVFLDPPRKGSDEATLAALADARRPVDLVSVVQSGDAGARSALSRRPRLPRSDSVQPFDMFPQTGPRRDPGHADPENLSLDANARRVMARTDRRARRSRAWRGSRLAAEEIALYGPQLESLLQHVDELSGSSTPSDVAATAQVIESRNVTRDDALVPCLPREKVLAGAPQPQLGYFRVPKIIAEED